MVDTDKVDPFTVTTLPDDVDRFKKLGFFAQIDAAVSWPLNPESQRSTCTQSVCHAASIHPMSNCVLLMSTAKQASLSTLAQYFTRMIVIGSAALLEPCNDRIISSTQSLHNNDPTWLRPFRH
jgi:hypothetical protein